MDNFLIKTDSYKVSHWKQYPKNTRRVYSYLESRGGRFKENVFFGLQAILLKHFCGQVFNYNDILAAELYYKYHFGSDQVFNATGFRDLLSKHYGYLPIIIKAVPEGTVVPYRNVLMTIENLDDSFPWLTNWLESLLLQVWYPLTIATQSREIKKTVLKYLEKTGIPETIDFKVHDFGYRGSTSNESAGLGGAAHLVNFSGTDTLAGINTILTYYNDTKSMGSFLAGDEDFFKRNINFHSIPATEHSTITSWGEVNEVLAHENMLDSFPEGLVASVSDSWDIIKCCTEIWGKALKNKVINRKGTVVVRPDSGSLPGSVLDVLRALESAFGMETNAKGYKVFPSCLRVIQGDGMEFTEANNTFESVLDAMEREGYSADNIAFGSGGGLLQKVNRDTQQMAIKCSSILINGTEKDVYKKPSGDPNKNSKRGRLALIKKEDGTFETVRVTGWENNNILEEVYRDGKLTKWHTFTEIKERARL